MRKIWIAGMAVALSLAAADLAQARMAGQGGTPVPAGEAAMGCANKMKGGMMGKMQGGMQGGMMAAQPLTQEQLEAFAKRHSLTVEQAKEMVESMRQMMHGQAAAGTGHTH